MERLAWGTPVGRGLLVAASLSATLWAYACGDGATEPPAPPPDPPRPTTVAVTPATAQLGALGATVQLSAEVRDQNGQAMAGVPVSWSSADTTVAAVDSAGSVTAAGSGTTTIVAAAGEATGEAVVTVMQAAGSVVVSPPADTVAPGDTLRLAAEAFDENGHRVEGAEFIWSSSNASVATVDATGLVTGVAEGTAMITATTGDASGTSAITVENPDRGALVALYEATDGPNWAHSHNWLTDAPLSKWHGVLSTDVSGRVVSLFLNANGLVGSIPPELGGLTKLRELELGSNALTGGIPHELGNLTNLASLRLSGNALTGPIPPELGNLTNLETLSLAGNWLSGPIPPELGNLSNLLSLELGENALSGPIPPELANLANLTGLRAYRNNLSGPIPRELADLTNLRHLGLSRNALTGPIPPELGQLAQLEVLWLSENNLTGPIPPELGNLNNLTHLYAYKSNLTGPIPPELGNLDKLKHLELPNNDLTGPIPAELGNLGALEVLTLGFNRLSGPIPSELGNLAELQSISLRNNLLTGALPRSFLGLKGLLKMNCRGVESGVCMPATDEFKAWVREVEARGDLPIAVDMPFCDEIDAEVLERLFDAADGDSWARSDGWLEDENLDRWHGVRTDSIGRVSGIDLSGNRLSGHLPDALGHLTAMAELRIADNDLAGRMPLSLTEVPLEEFDYGGTSLCAPDHAGFRDWLNGIPRRGGTAVPCPPLTDREILERFHASTARGSGTIPGWLSSAPLAGWQGVETDAAGHVVALRLPGRELHGALPRELGQLSDLRTLDLGNNSFSGPIPPELGDLHRLEQLRLAGNRISGEIPRELGRLSELRTLDLWNNSLSGRIPSELGDLHRLEQLHLDWNQISGEIPRELGQLSELRLLILSNNFLSGPIPPELGDLRRLAALKARRNRLSGSIPSALGRLAEAEFVDLSDNQFDGGIPPQLGALSRLLELNLSDNRLNGPIPAELGTLANLREIHLYGNDLTSSIPAELGGLANLAALNLGANRLTGPIPVALGGIANLAKLNLGDNELSGPLPAELAGAANLEELDLRSNALAGSVPREFGNLVLLRSLILADNAGLAGPLPPGITALGRLERFMAGGTGLCRPADSRFAEWFRAIADRRLVSCERGAAVYLTQAVQSWDDPVPLIAGRPALLRVFVTAQNGGTAMMPVVRATFFVDGAERHTVRIASNGRSIPAAVEDAERNLAVSANARIPAAVVVPGLEVVIEVDPEGTLDAALGVAKRIPESGRMAVDVRPVPPFHLTLVPLLLPTDPDSSVVETVSAMAADPVGHELLGGVRAVLPVTGIDVAAREPVISSSVETGTLLREVDAMRLIEGGSGHWMGITHHGVQLGRARGPGWVSVSSADARIIPHELGHNLGLLHAPCGNPAGLDPWFPHASGSIGAWGYDFDRDALVAPGSPDVMSYCRHPGYWISDYFFNKALRHRLANADAERVAARRRTPTLLVWGGRDEKGIPYLDPAFVVDAVPSPPGAGGSYTIQGSTTDGNALFSFTFDMPANADAEGEEAGFVFTLPLRAAWADSLASISLSGPGGSDILDASTDRPMAILRDPRTGRVREFLRGPPPPTQIAADAARQGAGQGMAVLFSRGIPSADAWQR